MDLDDTDDDNPTSSATPTRALLWQTVVASPHIKQILPVRVRDRPESDILVVRDNAIDAVEYDPNLETMRKVASTPPFPCSIRQAQVISGRRTIQGGAQQDHSCNHLALVALILQDARLVYIRVEDAVDGSIKFDCLQHPLLASSDPLHEPGHRVATDESSRTLAISGTEGPITVTALSGAESVQTSISVPPALPIIKMEFLRSPAGENVAALVALTSRDGRLAILTYIWDTRTPLKFDHDKASYHRLGREHGLPSLFIPLKAPLHFLLVCDQVMAIYRSNTDGNIEQVHTVPLSDDIAGASEEPEDGSDRAPRPIWINWARPVRRKGWAHEALYLAREDGHLKYVVIKAYASDVRIAELSDAGKLDMNVGSAFAILDIPQADLESGALPSDADSGRYTIGYSDILIGAGVHSDGGLYEIGVKNGLDTVTSTYDPLNFTRAAAHQPQKRQTISNWEPLHSIVSLSDHYPLYHASNASPAAKYTPPAFVSSESSRKDKIFGACGRAPLGSIAEFRYGCEASLRHGILFASERLDLPGASSIWSLSVRGRLPYFIISYPWKSVFCSIETVPPNDSPAFLEHLPGLDTSCQTLAAAIIVNTAESMPDTKDGMSSSIGHSGTIRTVIQVTDSEIISIRYDSSEGKLCKVSTKLVDKLSAAAIDAETGLILCISAATAGCHLTLYELIGDELLTGQAGYVDSICTAAAMFTNGRTPHRNTQILLGTEAGAVELFEVIKLGPLQRKKALVRPPSGHQGTGVESVCAVSGEDGSTVVLAGRRDGSMVITRLPTPGSTDPGLKVISLGDEPISFLGDLRDREQAFARSGSHIFAIGTPSKASGGEAKIREIFYTSPFDPSFRHGPLAAACLTDEVSSGELACHLIGLTDDGILCGALDPCAKALPLRTPMEGTPRLLTGAADLKLLVYASIINHVDEDEGIRYPVSTIFGMDPSSDQTSVKLEEGIVERLAFQLSPGEEAQCLTEMPMQVDEGTRSFILVGCGVLHEMDTDRGVRTVKGGSILWLKISRDSAGSRRISCSKRSEERGPVTALAPVDTRSFIYASGRKLNMRSWNEETKRWPMQEMQEMPSLVTAITVELRKMILVTTSEHSTFVLQLQPEYLTDPVRQVTVLNDPRKGLAHLAIPTDQPLVLSASSDGRVAGFSSAASSNNSTATYGVPPSFEARLSTAVNRLVHANVRPRYKQPRPECVLDRDIIGTSLDGAMFSFSILEDNGYLLLKLIENMCHRNTRICPLASAAERQTPLEADRERPQDLSINGDLLKVLIGRRDAETVLRDMLDAPLVPGYYGSRQRDFERVEDRRRAVKLLLKGLEKQIPVAALTAEQTSFERRILDYMRQALEDPF